MVWDKQVKEIARKRKLAKALGGATAVKRQHEKGRLTVRERIGKLVDPGFHRQRRSAP